MASAFSCLPSSHAPADNLFSSWDHPEMAAFQPLGFPREGTYMQAFGLKRTAADADLSDDGDSPDPDLQQLPVTSANTPTSTSGSSSSSSYAPPMRPAAHAPRRPDQEQRSAFEGLFYIDNIVPGQSVIPSATYVAAVHACARAVESLDHYYKGQTNVCLYYPPLRAERLKQRTVTIFTALGWLGPDMYALEDSTEAVIHGNDSVMRAIYEIGQAFFGATVIIPRPHIVDGQDVYPEN